jgi:hypothetical protein
MSLGNSRENTIASILGTTGSYASSYASSYVNSVQSYASTETGSYWMKVFYFLFFYVFILFIVLIFIHYSVTPIFKFTPGSPGYIGVPGSTDSIVYWNKGKQPLMTDVAPLPGDKISSSSLINAFSFSVDLYVTRINQTSDSTRLILFKTNGGMTNLPAPSLTSSLTTTSASSAGCPTTTSASSLMNDITSRLNLSPSVLTGSASASGSAPSTNQAISSDTFLKYMSDSTSMIMYLTKTNDLMVTFYSGSGGTEYSIPYIKNIPIYTPFRVTVVVQPKLFTVYLNGKQTFQRIIPETLTVNSKSVSLIPNQTFYSSPEWANYPTRSVFVQNFQLWQRPISYKEVIEAQPALALESNFGIPASALNAGRL